jgi:hypothetical protein
MTASKLPAQPPTQDAARLSHRALASPVHRADEGPSQPGLSAKAAASRAWLGAVICDRQTLGETSGLMAHETEASLATCIPNFALCINPTGCSYLTYTPSTIVRTSTDIGEGKSNCCHSSPLMPPLELRLHPAKM